MTVFDIPTPSLVLDLAALRRNSESMAKRARDLGVELRPHAKTPKSADAARIATEGQRGGLTVSTIREAEYFHENGFSDLTLAVTTTPEKLDRVAALQHAGASVGLITDSAENARAIADRAGELNTTSIVYIEIDTGYGRSGVLPESDELIAIGNVLHESAGTTLQGVLTHAGHSYECIGEQAIANVAEQERSRIVQAADRLRAAGLPCPVVSVGSTPTIHFARSLEGVTEARPGNYMFYDLSMVARGVCSVGDIAVSIATTVISSQPGRHKALIDAGGLALSKDRSANVGKWDGVGYGLVQQLDGSAPWGDVIVHDVCQEQGWISMRDSADRLPADKLPIGTRLRVLPNHSCMTCAAYDSYYVVDGGTDIVAEWGRVNGW